MPQPNTSNPSTVPANNTRHLFAVPVISAELEAALQHLRLNSFADFEEGDQFDGDPAAFAAALERAATATGWRIRTVVTADGVFAELLGVRGCDLVRPAEVHHRYSDADLLGYLRRAAEYVGGAPLSESDYEEVRADLGGAAASTMVRRFGSWEAACSAAGIAAEAPGRRVAAVWTQQRVVRRVADYLMVCGVGPTSQGYGEWAKGRAAAPGHGVIVRYGGWTQVKALAEREVDARRNRQAA